MPVWEKKYRYNKTTRAPVGNTNGASPAPMNATGPDDTPSWGELTLAGLREHRFHVAIAVIGASAPHSPRVDRPIAQIGRALILQASFAWPWA